MKILFTGHGPKPLRGWPAHRKWPEASFVEALRAEGHDIFFRSNRKVFPDFRPDVCLWNRCPRVYRPREIQELRRLYRCPQVYWHCDGFTMMPGVLRPNTEWFWLVAPEFDLILEVERGLFAEYEKRTGRSWRYMPPGFDPEFHPLNATARPEWRAEIGWVGKRESGNSMPYYQRRNAFIRKLAETYNMRAWAIKPAEWVSLNISCDGPAVGHDFAAACKSVDIMLAMSAKAWCDGAWSNRGVNVMGCGGFLLAEHTPGLDEFFTPGEHLAVFDPNDPADAIAQARYWLDRPEERERIAKQGQAHVLLHHTWRHRAREAVQIMEGELL